MHNTEFIGDFMGYALGIDVGTTKVAAVLSDSKRRVVVDSASVVTNAEIVTEPGFAEQDVSKILDAVNKCIKYLNHDLRKKVEAIGITGQMHGMLFWSSTSPQVSSLTTWQDGRCTATGFLHKLQSACRDSTLRDGYGLVTLAWCVERRPDLVEGFDRASTIHDYLASRLTGATVSRTDPSDAASWGMYNNITNCWNLDKVKAAKIPEIFLPTIHQMGSKIGNLTREYSVLWGIPEAPVTIAIGDNQASIYGTVQEPESEIALTIGTGGQISVIVDKSYLTKTIPPTIEFRPYVGDKVLVVAASLSGGSAIAWLVKTVQSWCKDLGIQTPDNESIYRKIDDLGRQSLASPLKVGSSFIGERYEPSMRGSICNIDLHNMTFGNLSAALVQSIIKTMHDMVPEEMFTGRKRVIGSGNGLRRLALARQITEDVFGLPLILTEGREEAALGASLLAADSL